MELSKINAAGQVPMTALPNVQPVPNQAQKPVEKIDGKKLACGIAAAAGVACLGIAWYRSGNFHKAKELLSNMFKGNVDSVNKVSKEADEALEKAGKLKNKFVEFFQSEGVTQEKIGKYVEIDGKKVVEFTADSGVAGKYFCQLADGADPKSVKDSQFVFDFIEELTSDGKETAAKYIFDKSPNNILTKLEKGFVTTEGVTKATRMFNFATKNLGENNTPVTEFVEYAGSDYKFKLADKKVTSFEDVQNKIKATIDGESATYTVIDKNGNKIEYTAKIEDGKIKGLKQNKNTKPEPEAASNKPQNVDEPTAVELSETSKDIAKQDSTNLNARYDSAQISGDEALQAEIEFEDANLAI